MIECILIDFGGALRPSELAAPDIEDVAEDTDAHGLRSQSSKTDQEAEGGVLHLPLFALRPPRQAA
jgi:hypothetical protein